ncbi:hypothetical protein ACWD6R_00940 [Streptomyces sp. NPDC005151]
MPGPCPITGPNLRSPLDDARLDLTDLFAFTVPGDRTVLITNVNPVAPSGAAAWTPRTGNQLASGITWCH